MHKTGSSSIQRSLRDYNDGITRYANLGYENHSIPIYTAFSDRHLDYNIWRRAGLSGEAIEQKRLDCRAKIEDSLTEETEQNIIFSGEDMTKLSTDSLISLKAALNKHCGNIKIFAYIRDPISFNSSAIQEYIKNGENSHFQYLPRYKETFEKFMTVFGFDNVTLKTFRRSELTNSDVVTDFCKHFDIALKHKPAHVNESLSTEAIKCIYILNTIVNPLDGDTMLNSARSTFISTLASLLPGSFSVNLGITDSEWLNSDCDWLENVTSIKLDRSGIYVAKNLKAKSYLFFSSLANNTIDTILAYLNTGIDFGRDPRKIIHRLYIECFSALSAKRINFNPESYLNLNPDVRNAGANPYEHYLKYGEKEGRQF